MKTLDAFTIGMGDRFGRQGRAQLAAVMQARRAGIAVSPVWNKSNREHLIVGSEPEGLRHEADEAVAALGWKEPYYVDADHIRLGTVDKFLKSSDFFTIDVADAIGQPSAAASLEQASRALRPLHGEIALPGVSAVLPIGEKEIAQAVETFLPAVRQAGTIYRHMLARRHDDIFVTEVSMDETAVAQGPAHLLIILKLLADEGIPVQTIAPKFIGRFNKGVDYVGDIVEFERQFDAHLGVVAYARAQFRFPASLKLSMHSGSDKFSLYPVVNALLRRHGAGLHLKTAGTTWLEEVIGLAEAGGDGLDLAKHIYAEAVAHYDDVTAPYAEVIDVDRRRLPDVATVMRWTSAEYVAALRHVPSCPAYNRDFRQLLHVAFKVAAALGRRFTEALDAHADAVGRNVTDNLLDRHIRPLFG
jgi:hypothetical protein